MHKIISTISSTALLALASCALAGPAFAAPPSGFKRQDQYIGNYCGQNPRASQCGDWKTNHAHWGNSQYQGFYRSHQGDAGFGGGAVASLFGLAIGAAIGGAIQNSAAASGSSAHVQACESAYRSYNAQTDTYLGYDGVRHPCLS